MTKQLLGIGSRIKHNDYGVGVITNTLADTYRVTFIQYGNMEIPHSNELTIIEAVEPDPNTVSMKDVERSLIKILQKWGGAQEVIDLHNKWEGGALILQPGNTDLKSKTIPIDVFFHKIVMVRDRLRVMEQRINSSSMTDEEKVNLQQYITRIYGSLTTFNVLFKQKSDHFKGAKS